MKRYLYLIAVTAICLSGCHGASKSSSKDTPESNGPLGVIHKLDDQSDPSKTYYVKPGDTVIVSLPWQATGAIWTVESPAGDPGQLTLVSKEDKPCDGTTPNCVQYKVFTFSVERSDGSATKTFRLTRFDGNLQKTIPFSFYVNGSLR